MGDFQQLKVWQRSKDVAVRVYKITANGNFERDYGLRDQMRRAAVSISSNIAEGDESGTNSMAVRYFNIAKGSSAELLTQTIIAHDIGYLDLDTFEYLKNECLAVSAMLEKLIKVRKR